MVLILVQGKETLAGMSPSDLIEKISERTPDGVTEHDKRQLDIFEAER